MAKKSVKQSAVSLPAEYKPKPSMRLELDSLPKGLPDVSGRVQLMVKGKIMKMAAPGADYSDMACMSVMPESVKVVSGKRGK